MICPWGLSRSTCDTGGVFGVLGLHWGAREALVAPGDKQAFPGASSDSLKDGFKPVWACAVLNNLRHFMQGNISLGSSGCWWGRVVAKAICGQGDPAESLVTSDHDS